MKLWQWMVDFWGELWNYKGVRSDRRLVAPIYSTPDYYFTNRELAIRREPAVFTNEDIRGYYQEGFTILQVAKMTGQSYHKTRKMLHQEGVVRKKGVRVAS